MSDVSLAVQKAVIAALRASPALAAVVGSRIYDAPPERLGSALAEGAFVALGNETGAPAIETDADEGFEITLSIEVWARRPSARPTVKRALRAIHDALHNAEPALEDGAVVIMRVIDTRTDPEPDGVTAHGRARLRVLTD